MQDGTNNSKMLSHNLKQTIPIKTRKIAVKEEITNTIKKRNTDIS